MTGVVALVHFRRQSRYLRCVATLVLAALSVSVLLAPSAEAHAGQSAPAHVEADGTHLHHSHSPETCPACTALQLTGLPSQTQLPPLVAAPHDAPTARSMYHLVRGDRIDPKVARAPPM
jgi:hypothetical protein